MPPDELVRYLTAEDAADLVGAARDELGATEFACVRNLEYVYSPLEIYPLAPRVTPPLTRVVAFAVDMDGTSTTTEPLALHSLEYMVRRMTGRIDKAAWDGLDAARDHPFVIGNSNYRHVEFLVERYGERLDSAALREAFFEALVWTLANMSDPQRRRDVLRDARNGGLGDMLEDAGFQRVIERGVDAENAGQAVAPLVKRFGSAFRCSHSGELISAALDIYYYRYHSILRTVERGEGKRLSRELLGDEQRRLIEPMPGYDVFLALVKGWLGREAAELCELLTDDVTDAARQRLAALAEHFGRQPAKLSLVTASIAYEAHASMKEVIAVTAEHVRNWPIAAEHRERVAERLAEYQRVFDGFVCAADACEHRLKPHRDLYSLALKQMSIPRDEYQYCVGLEDTEPGIVALRAAGVGCAVALPNRDTSRQNYSAAAKIIPGGLPELILDHNLLLPETGGDGECSGRAPHGP